MHIGIVHYAAPPVVGGVEQTIFHHTRLLLALGHKVTVVAGQGASFLPGVSYHEEPLVSSRNLQILSAGGSLAQGKHPPDLSLLVAELRHRLLAHLEACDAIIGHNLFTLHKNLPLTLAVAALVADANGPPWVAWHHDFAWLRAEYQQELHAGEPWELLRRPWSGVRHVTVSAAQQADLAQLYHLPQDSIEVIPPGVDPLAFLRVGDTVGQLVARWGLLEADALFLLPARITRRKNIALALRWLAAIREYADWDARLVVTGPPGPHNPTNAAYLDELLDLRQALGLRDVAHFVAQAGPDPHTPLLLSDAEVAAWYSLADALLFPSEQEGFGIPLLEAGLVRLPIFATNLPPFRESAGNYATFFSSETPLPQVAERIVASLRKDPAFQLRRRVLTNFTWHRLVTERLLPLLQTHIASPQKDSP